MSANLLTEKEFMNSSVDFPKPHSSAKEEFYYVNNGTVLYKYEGLNHNTYIDERAGRISFRNPALV